MLAPNAQPKLLTKLILISYQPPLVDDQSLFILILTHQIPILWMMIHHLPVTQMMNLMMTSNIGQPHTQHSKVQEPNQFDGSDSWKLQSFLVQCQLKFNDQVQSQLYTFFPEGYSS
jgi:hypothetical protein